MRESRYLTPNRCGARDASDGHAGRRRQGTWASSFRTLHHSFRQLWINFELQTVFDVYNEARVDSQAEDARSSAPENSKGYSLSLWERARLRRKSGPAFSTN